MGFDQYHAPASELSQETRTPKWRVAAQKVLFQGGNIIENKERGEDAEDNRSMQES
jgi:hypothetical protein